MLDVDLSDLRNFVCVAETRSFTAAARRVHLSTPAVSKSIKRLETRLETTLFERSSRRVQLSLAGAALLDEAQRVLDAVNRLGEALDAKDGRLRGELRVGTMEVFTTLALPAALAKLAREHPGLVSHSYAMGPGQVVRLVAEGRLDVGLLVLDPAAPPVTLDAVELVELLESPLILACGPDHPLAESGEITDADLLAYPFVVPEFFDGVARRGLDGFPGKRARKVGATVEQLRMAVEMVASGAFLGCFPQVAIRCQLNHRELLALAGLELPPVRLAAVVRRHAPAVRALLDELGQRLHEALKLECAS